MKTQNNIFQWKSFEEVQPPKNIPVLLKLEKEMLNSYFHTGIFYDKVSFIGGRFSYDAPKPLYWTEIVDINLENKNN